MVWQEENAVGQDEHPEGPTQLVKQPERGAAAGGWVVGERTLSALTVRKLTYKKSSKKSY